MSDHNEHPHNGASVGGVDLATGHGDQVVEGQDLSLPTLAGHASRVTLENISLGKCSQNTKMDMQN